MIFHSRSDAPPTCARLAALAATMFVLVQSSLAQADDDGREGDWNGSFSVSNVEQSDADLDSGGEVGRSGRGLALSAQRQLSPAFGIGASFRYDYDQWDFTNLAASGGVAPWKDIHRASVGFQVRTRLNDTWQMIAAPMLQYAGEDGAKSSDALRYGGAIAFSRGFGPDLNVGFGVLALHDIDENRVRPYLAVLWKINEQWRLGSPDSAGPSGLAGIELAYRRDARWDFGTGVGFNEYRFRLDKDGPTAGGVGESRSLPLYGRVSFRPNARIRFDAYAGAAFDNRLRVEYADGRKVSEEYDTAPTLGLAVSFSP